MTKDNGLERFINPQAKDHEIALTEIKKGKKQSHWMWYIFPQIPGLGFSTTSIYYAIKNVDEAERFLQHPILGNRLIEISSELLTLKSNDAKKILGTPDDLKLKSCMTLFSSLPSTDLVFKLVLDKFFNGSKDDKTIQIMNLD